MTISHTNAQTASGSAVSSLTLNYTIGDANAEALYVGMCDTDLQGDEDVVPLGLERLVGILQGCPRESGAVRGHPALVLYRTILY